MSTELTALFSAVISKLRDVLALEWAWPSVDSAFALYVASTSQLKSELELFPARKCALWPSNHALHEAPSLATAGYVLDIQPSASSPSQRAEWLSGLTRLSEKKDFPDYQFFAYRPLEVLGIALGIANLPEAARFRDWFERITARVLKERASDLWTQVVIGLAAWKAGVLAQPMIHVLPESMPLEDLALVRWLIVVHTNMPSASMMSSELLTLDGAILKRCCTETLPPSDIAQASLLHYAVQSAVYARIESALAETWQITRDTKDAEKLVVALCRRFHLFATQIKQRRGARSTIQMSDEYDVQDAMHALLRLHFDDVRGEEVAPSYAGKSTRMDFLLKQEKIVVETKMTRINLNQNDVANELIEDKERYRTHPDLRTLICLVYDPAQICRNPAALENDVSSESPAPRCVVVVVPKGL